MRSGTINKRPFDVLLEELADRLALWDQGNGPILQVGQGRLMVDAQDVIDRRQQVAGAKRAIERLGAVGGG